MRMIGAVVSSSAQRKGTGSRGTPGALDDYPKMAGGAAQPLGQLANGLFADRIACWVRGGGTRLEREPRWRIGRNVLGLWKE